MTDPPESAYLIAERRIEVALRKRKRALDLSRLGLTSLPDSLGSLTNLTVLNLDRNQLASLPNSLGELTDLSTLWLRGNKLCSLPDSLGNLSNLTDLNLDDNRIVQFPLWLWGLRRLSSLSLSNAGLTLVPRELGGLASLTRLWLNGNQLTSLPDSLGGLTNLTVLWLSDNHLSSLPNWLGNFTHLTALNLRHNLLASLPDSLGTLTEPTTLGLDDNRLTSLPHSLGNLTNLNHLSLENNLLTSLPDSLGSIAKLTGLHLQGNRLASLPGSLGDLTKLTGLHLDGNPLTDPPPEIINQGTKATLRFLRERRKSGRRQWVSKLILVGEGGVGKSELLRSLKGEQFAGNLETTHGIVVSQLELAHPSTESVEMSLNCWDFGGQEVYHATHQFFLTQRSLFVLVWNARLGWEACKLYYWLDAIKARAPDAPVVIVSTWIDERNPDLPLADIKRAYPQVVANHAVSNKKRVGIEELRTALAVVAARLPLMGEEWPALWLGAAETIRASKARHVTPQEFRDGLVRSGVTSENHGILGRMLHDLGDILWFQDDIELSDIVILKPQWVTEYISQVLESEDVIGRDGIYTRPHMDQLWSDLRPEMRDHFLRLMERFDLSYRTLDPQNREISLVVERLPLDPADYEDEWRKPLLHECCRTITMNYRMNTVPAGIPSWFIARSHRFTTHTHWRNGALFADGSERRHLALIRCSQHERVVELSVRGPMPHNFFALLRDGFELTLGRFPGLDVTRTMPCPGHDRRPCTGEFVYANLERALSQDPVVEEVQCPVSFKPTSVLRLLFGLLPETGGEVLKEVRRLRAEFDAGKTEILAKLEEAQALSQRQFLTLFTTLQKDPDVCCPNVFILTGDGRRRRLRFLCQAPGEWHAVKDAGCYRIEVEPELLGVLRPYASELLAILKTAATLFRPTAQFVFPQYAALHSYELELMAEAMKLAPDIEPKHQESELAKRIGPRGIAEPEENAETMRALRRLLDEKDPDRSGLGLKLVPTPEGHYLWLCAHHAAEYTPGPAPRK